MIDFTVEVENGEIVRRGLENLFEAIPRISRQRIYYALLRVLTILRNEPPEMESYRRRGILRAGWPYRPVKTGDTAYRIYNDVEHTRYVVGDEEGLGQTWFHAGRWPILIELIKEELNKMPEEATKAIVIYASAYGLA